MTTRSKITSVCPWQQGHGNALLWTREIQGRTYRFYSVRMPDGERRFFASRLQEGKDARFACYWTPVLSWIFKPKR